jgi:alkyl sulfatase BDS1-like metallo-beta-lactamase superfamily hydrolase
MIQEKNPPLANLMTTGEEQAEAVAIGHGIFANLGVGNSYLVTTDDGDVIVNAGLFWEAERGKALFAEVSTAPIRFVILTQSHPNQYGGADCFMQEGTKLIAGRDYTLNRGYWADLRDYYSRRNNKLWGGITLGPKKMVSDRNYAPDVLVDDSHGFDLGGRRFELLAVPGGETTDSIIVWLPQDRIAIVGNLFGPMFGHQPNLNTVRGDKLRSAAAYIASVKRVRALEPEMILTGHETITGRTEIQRALTQLIDSVQWLLDHTIAGMNAGKDIHTIMREAKLPDALVLGEGHGKATWNCRAIWAEYTGWFDYDSTASLYPVSRRSISPDLVALAGGADRLAERARERLDAGEPVEAIHLLDIVRDAEPDNAAARAVLRDALTLLLERGASKNLSETMWLRAELAALEGK